MPDEHSDVLIRIDPWDKDKGAYPVEARLDDGSFFPNGRLRLDQQVRAAGNVYCLRYVEGDGVTG